MRQLVLIIQEMPDSLVANVSSEAVMVRQRIKWPLVLVCLSAGILSAFTQVFFKYFGEARLSEKKNIYLIVSMLLCGIVFGVIQLLTVNVAMKYYNQVDVVPLEGSINIMAGIGAGLFVMNEAKDYKTVKILGILATAAFTVYGIHLIARRTSART